MKKILDLGCGPFPLQIGGYEAFGIDLEPNLPQVLACDVVLEDLPFPNDYFEIVFAKDFLEHIPNLIYLPDPAGKMIRKNPLINLFNEIYRILKPNGDLYIEVPIYPHEHIFMDPTHCSIWTNSTINYFCGDYFGFHDRYKHTSNYELIKKQNHGIMVNDNFQWHRQEIILRAKK